MADEVNAVHITQKAAAEAIGVSSPYLSKLRKQGRIVPEPDGLYDLAKLRDQLRRGQEMDQTMAALTRRKDRAQELTAADLGIDTPAAAHDDESDYGSDHHENYKIARSLREREEAAIARIKRMQAEESLVLKADVEISAYTEARVIRDAIIGALPTKIAPLLAPVADAFELERMLRAALREALLNCLRGADGVS